MLLCSSVLEYVAEEDIWTYVSGGIGECRKLHSEEIRDLNSSSNINTFAASYLNSQGLNNSYLKSPTSTLVDLTFQSRALRSFSLNQLRNLSL